MKTKQSVSVLKLDDELKDLLDWYKESLKLDKHDLDNCCINQPEIFEKVSSDLARYTSLRDEAKRSVVDLEASVDVELRKASSDKKITERELAALVRVDVRVQEAHDTLAYRTYVVARLAALKEAFEHRRAMIKELVVLHQLGYWGDTSGRGLAREASDRKASTVREEQARVRVPLSEARKRRRESLKD